MVVGGANLSVFYTADEIANTIGATAEILMTKKIKTSLTRTSFTLDQNEDSPALSSFLEAYAPRTTVTADQGEYEDGTKYNSTTAGSQTLMQIIYGGKETSGTNPKRKVVIMFCKLAQDAGSFDQESGKFTKPKVSGEVVNNDADMGIPATYFLTTLVTGATLVTVPKNVGYKEVWITAV